MRDYLIIGSSSYDEDCVQVGDPHYYRNMLGECLRFMALRRTLVGPEPEGAELCITAFEHDFGTYHEVVCWYDTMLPASFAYAQRCEDEMPATWEG